MSSKLKYTVKPMFNHFTAYDLQPFAKEVAERGRECNTAKLSSNLEQYAREIFNKIASKNLHQRLSEVLNTKTFQEHFIC